MKVGDIIDGKYELVRLMGQGGMGAVWEGRHVQIGRRAALKFLHPQVAHDAEIASRFLREAQAAAAIGSDHIVDIYDVGQLPGGEPFLVMEYLSGEDLGSLIARFTSLPPAMAVGLSLQICDALTPAHARGIVHRDLKPANLFLTRLGDQEGWLKVLDFGIAKARRALTGRTSSQLTRTGTTLGTPHYMAPEQFVGTKDVDQRADVYSTGVILYEMLTGRTPFDGETYEELIIRVATEKPTPPRALKPELDESLEQVVLRSMERGPEQRFSSMEDLAVALRPLAGTEQQSLTPATVVSRQDDVSTQASPVTPGASDLLRPTEATPIGAQAIPDPPINQPALTPTVAGPPTPPSRTGPQASTPTAWESEATVSHPSARSSRLPLMMGVAAVSLVVAGAVVVALVLATGEQEQSAPRPANGPTQDDGSAASKALEVSAAMKRERRADSQASPKSNAWVRIEAAPPNTLLGLPAQMSGSEERGFRASRRVSAPTYPYEIQQHEVTWEELRPWLAKHPEHAVTQPLWLPVKSSERYPATSVPWSVAQTYCKSLGGSLPTEEEWEYAARGPERRPYPWGTQEVDLAKTHVYRPERPLSQAMSNDQDATPGDASRVVFDLLGNAREWTADLWREDEPGQDESWVQVGEMSFRAVRGLPPNTEQPSSVPFVGTAHRSALCATGDCPGETVKVLAYVGFRCSRRVQ